MEVVFIVHDFGTLSILVKKLRVFVLCKYTWGTAMAYDSTRAAVFNRLIQLGYSEDQAAQQAGISDADFADYAIGTNGLIGPLIIGSGPANNIATTPFTTALYDQSAGPGGSSFQPGVSPFGEQDDPLEEPPPTIQPGAQTTFDEFGNILYPTADDGLAFSELPDDDLAFRQGTDPGPGYPTADDGLAFSELPDDNLAFTEGVNPGPGYVTTYDEFGNEITLPAELPDDDLAWREGTDPGPGYGVSDDNLAFEPGSDDDLAFAENNVAEAETKAKLATAQRQATAQARINQTSLGDWRVRLSLATGSDYLYNAKDAEVLKPLVATNGVIFPYTPSIQTSYEAKYDNYELTHSNFRGYFYKNSRVADITITGTFTAQDTTEAAYLLAVIHFFRSASKMFYGQDEKRGAPPPLLFLSGLGQYQFNNHSCLLTNFQYVLPNDVDYIRMTPNNQGLNLAARQSLVSTSPPSTLSAVLSRLSTAGLPSNAQPPGPQDLGAVAQVVAGTGQSTYVPTRMEITITLLPVNTRSQVSQQFSLKDYANGALLRRGFW